MPGLVVIVALASGMTADVPSERMTVTLRRPSRSSTESNRRDEPGTSDTLPRAGMTYSLLAGGTTQTE